MGSPPSAEANVDDLMLSKVGVLNALHNSGDTNGPGPHLERREPQLHPQLVDSEWVKHDASSSSYQAYDNGTLNNH